MQKYFILISIDIDENVNTPWQERQNKWVNGCRRPRKKAIRKPNTQQQHWEMTGNNVIREGEEEKTPERPEKIENETKQTKGRLFQWHA